MVDVRPSHTALLELADLYGYEAIMKELLTYPPEDVLAEMLDRLKRMWDLDYLEKEETD